MLGIGSSVSAKSRQHFNPLRYGECILWLDFTDKNYIYSDKNWNRFVYKGKHIIGRNILKSEFPEEINILENILFKGCGHYKRGQGITLLSQKKIQQYEKELYYLFVCLEGVFKKLELRNEK